MGFASNLHDMLVEKGHLCDFIDPCSGLPLRSYGNNIYDEVQSMQVSCVVLYPHSLASEKDICQHLPNFFSKMLLQYPTMDAGCCKVLLHPRWGPNVYPASIFTNAPTDVVIGLLDILCISSPSKTD